MFCIWFYFTDKHLDILVPEQPGYHTTIQLSRLQTGWAEDVQVGVRYLNNECFVSVPDGFHCDAMQNGEIQLTSHHVLSGNIGAIAVDVAKASEIGMDKFELTPSTPVTIGRNPENLLQINSPMVTGMHGSLIPTKNGWTYRDSSRNGSYINHLKIDKSEHVLRVCDELHIAPGLKLIYLGDHLAISSMQRLLVNKLPAWRYPTPSKSEPSGTNAIIEVHRAPRLMQMADTEPLEIEPPLNKAQQRDTSLLMTIGPSLTMIFPMLMGATVASMASNGSSFMVAGLTMIGTSSLLAVGWGLANYRRQNKQALLLESKRLSIYRSYIQSTEKTLQTRQKKEQLRLLRQNPSFSECITLPQTDHLRLWERMPKHEDFLVVRLGLGTVMFPGEISVGHQQLSLIDDDLRNEPERLYETYKMIKDAPVCLDLRDQDVVGILGNDSAVTIVTQMLIQIASLHSYHDVKIVLLANESQAEQWAWARWLPHAFPTEDRKLRMTVSSSAGIREVLNYLDEVLQLQGTENKEVNESDESKTKTNKVSPHYVVFCLDAALLLTEPVLGRLVNGEQNFSLVVAAPDMERLPKECKSVLSAKGEYSGIFGASGESKTLQFESADIINAQLFARQIAPLRVRDSVMGAAIPSIVSFLELYDAHDVKQLDVWRFWNENHAFNGLVSTIGFRAGAKPFILDISDKKHGPHGLVAGTTGSGKSVMLQTYILSLALNYHPQDVQFILIDYKGGGMSDVFSGLPHIAGTIDNLQTVRSIRRALASVQGEIRRRETIFKAAGVSNVDEYMRQREFDQQLEPLSHLIIVVDEFAELKKEQPEFMHELISASRVGRSVGIHLILATQKPSNSVDDEIWSNSRFRICLRVQNRSDSMDMLKRPDASFIKGMGRCFVQIGNNEIFEEVQTSWSGAAYEPNHSGNLEKPVLLNEAGQPVKVRIASEKKGESITQMSAVLSRIREVVAEHAITTTRTLWQEELPELIDLNKIEPLASSCFDDNGWPKTKGDQIEAPIGVADDLQNQRHIPALVYLTKNRNHLIVGQSTSGKSTFLQTLTVSLCQRYAPDQVQIYMMALTSHTLGVLEALPHVADIVYDSEPENIIRLLYMLTQENERRRKLFSQAATDNFSSYANACSVRLELTRVSAIVIMVDRIAQLLEGLTDEESTTMLYALIREGSGRGIFFVVTAMAINEVPTKLRDSFFGIGLQLHSREDYLDVLGKRIPSEMSDILPCPGRGVMIIQDDFYEMQTALYTPDSDDAERATAITELGRRMTVCWKGRLPERLPRIPDNADWKALLELAKKRDLPNRAWLAMGYRYIDTQPVLIDLYKKSAWLIVGHRGGGKTNYLKGIASMFMEMNAQFHLFSNDSRNSDYKAFGVQIHPVESQEAYLVELDHLIQERNNARKAIASNGNEALQKLHMEFQPYVILIDGVYDTQIIPALKARMSEIASEAEGYGLYLFATVNANELMLLKRDPLVSALASCKNGIALCKLMDCDIWDNQLSFAKRSKTVPLGQGYIIGKNNIEYIVIPGPMEYISPV